jgi:hypothetical protein
LSNAVIGSISSATNLPRTAVAIESITAMNRRRELLREILQTGGVSVVYTITATNTDAVALTTMLQTTVSDGSFETALKSNGFTAATATVIPTVVDESPTSR